MDIYDAYPFLDRELEKTDHLICRANVKVRSNIASNKNNLAEQSVRPFTTKRKCLLHFNSDEGVDMSAVYHCIISTVKLCDKSLWSFRCEALRMDTTSDTCLFQVY